MLADDLRKGPRLGAGRDLLVGPSGRVLRDCRVVGSTEDDLLLLDAVAHRRAAVDAHVDGGDTECDQYQTGDNATDLKWLSHSHLVPPPCVVRTVPRRLGRGDP